MNFITKLQEKHKEFKNRNTVAYKVKRGERTPQEVLDRQLVNFTCYAFAFVGDVAELAKTKDFQKIKESIKDYYNALEEENLELADFLKDLIYKCVGAQKSLMETILMARKQKILYGAIILSDSDECAIVNPGIPEFTISKEDFLKLVKEEKYYEEGYRKYAKIEQEKAIKFMDIPENFLSYIYDIFRQGADLLIDEKANLDQMFTTEGYIMLSYGGDFEVIEEDYLDFSELNDEHFKF